MSLVSLGMVVLVGFFVCGFDWKNMLFNCVVFFFVRWCCFLGLMVGVVMVGGMIGCF